MTAQFLLLMVFLEKTWFSPVGKALDDRDATLRSKLGSVKDNSGDLKKLQEEAEKVLREARQEAQALIKDAKSKTQDEQGKKLAETKAVSCLQPNVSCQGNGHSSLYCASEAGIACCAWSVDFASEVDSHWLSCCMAHAEN